MSTFAELLERESGVGVAYLLQGSADSFATTPYRFSTQDGLFGGTVAYDSRILSLDDLQRGFGVNGTLAASSISLRLANTDGGLDAFITTPATIFKTRWRLDIVLYDVANPSDLATKRLGVFVPLDFPARDGTSVVFSFADDSFGYAAELAIPPTASEAFAVALDATSTDPPVPLALGDQTLVAAPRPYTQDATYIDYVLCATTDTADPTDAEVTSLTFRGSALTQAGLASHGWTEVEVGRTGVYRDSDGDNIQVQLWTLYKTAALAKDGRTWRVLYARVNTANFRDWLSAQGLIARDTMSLNYGQFTVSVNVSLAYFNTVLMPTLEVTAAGPRWGSRTYTQTGFVSTVRAPDIAYDLLRYYSRGLDSSQVDQPSFAAVTAAAPMFNFTARVYFSNFIQSVNAVTNGGALGRRTQPSVASTAQGMLRRALSDLCQGGLFDIVTNWDGKFVAHVLANGFALQTSTPHEVDETLMANIADKVPSPGERWAPYNRVIFSSNGRIIDNRTSIESWGQVLPRTINDSAVELETAWSGTDFGIGTLGGIGTLESVVRPVISFEYPLNGLAWELGEFVSIQWSRGASGLPAWSGALFRIEDLVLHPSSCTLTVRAVWIEDLAQQLPYLLDDETLLALPDVTLTDTATCNGTSTVQLGAACLILNMRVGAILVLKDATLAADNFGRYGAWRITAFDDVAKTLTVATNAEGAYPTSGTVLSGSWTVMCGATIYPDAISDPTNYPSGGTMYGKLSESGTFSNSSTANVLQAG